MKPKLLDTYCCAGGCSKGFTDAGFDVYGIDIDPQPDYPYPFFQGDAIEALRRLLRGEGIAFLNGETLYLRDFAAIHASPPCQAFSLASLWQGVEKRAEHPDLVDETRELLDVTGLPYTMENVEGSPLRRDLVLCGEMFGLRVHRHRVFELGGWFAMQPRHAPHHLKGARDNCHIEDGHARQVVGNYADHADASDAMGIDWMSRKSLTQAIPPAYTEFIGDQLLIYVEARSKNSARDVLGGPYRTPSQLVSEGDQ